MKPYKLPGGQMHGPRTWRWCYSERFRGRLSGGRRRVTACWPVSLAWRELSDGAMPYPSSDQAIWTIAYWRRRPRPVGHLSHRLVATDDGSYQQQRLVRRAQASIAASCSRWWKRAYERERMW